MYCTRCGFRSNTVAERALVDRPLGDEPLRQDLGRPRRGSASTASCTDAVVGDHDAPERLAKRERRTKDASSTCGGTTDASIVVATV